MEVLDKPHKKPVLCDKFFKSKRSSHDLLNFLRKKILHKPNTFIRKSSLRIVYLDCYSCAV